jgi:hypothetical protein
VHADTLGVTNASVGLDPARSGASADANIDAVMLGAELLLAGLELRSAEAGRAPGDAAARTAAPVSSAPTTRTGA